MTYIMMIVEAGKVPHGELVKDPMAALADMAKHFDELGHFGSYTKVECYKVRGTGLVRQWSLSID